MADNNEKEMKRTMAWLESQKPKPVDDREKKRMAAAIEFDLEQCILRGGDVQKRLARLDYCGYLYEGMTFKVPSQ